MSNIEDYKTLSFPITELARILGLVPARGTANTYFAPGRNEATASLRLYPAKQMWWDYGAGTGGGLLDLIMYCQPAAAMDVTAGATPKARAMAFLKRLAGTPGRTSSTPAPARGQRVAQERRILIENWRPEDDKDITDPGLLGYAASRHWQEDVLRRYCHQLRVTIKDAGHSRFMLGFPNIEKGYVLRAPGEYGKMSSNQAPSRITSDGRFSSDVTTHGLLVFEGFGNFLSKLSYDILTGNANHGDRTAPGIDVLVLNSWHNISRPQSRQALNEYDIILWYGDNDKAGYKALEIARQMTKAPITDMVPTYAGKPGSGIDDFNDFLNMWCSRHGIK